MDLTRSVNKMLPLAEIVVRILLNRRLDSLRHRCVLRAAHATVMDAVAWPRQIHFSFCPEFSSDKDAHITKVSPPLVAVHK